MALIDDFRHRFQVLLEQFVREAARREVEIRDDRIRELQEQIEELKQESAG